MKIVSLQKKRTSFGEDAAAYQSARPPYPATVYDQLMAHVPLSLERTFLKLGREQDRQHAPYWRICLRN